MRLLPLLLFALPFCVLPAAAQPAPSPGLAPAPATMKTPQPATEAAAASQAEPAGKSAPAEHQAAWEKRFARANITHDGHLTLQQAKAGYVTISRSFKHIDLDGKGYVTLDDIRAWHKQRSEARHKTTTPAADAVTPRPAYHRSIATRKPLNTSSQQPVPGPAIPTGTPPAPPKGIDPDAPS